MALRVCARLRFAACAARVSCLLASAGVIDLGGVCCCGCWRMFADGPAKGFDCGPFRALWAHPFVSASPPWLRFFVCIWPPFSESGKVRVAHVVGAFDVLV